MQTYFVDLALPLPLPRAYTYRVPQHLAGTFGVGCRVVVQFGKKRVLTGVVLSIHTQPPAEYEARPLLDVLEQAPSLNDAQLSFFNWMAAYYCCALGEVIFAALPSGLKLSSESRLQLNPDAEVVFSDLGPAELQVYEAIQQHETLSYEELARLIPDDNLTLTVRRLLAKRLVLAYEQVRERYTPRKVKVLALAPALVADAEKMAETLERLRRAPRRLEALSAFLALVPYQQAGGVWVERTRLTIDGTVASAALRALIDDGILLEEERVVSRLNLADGPVPAPSRLSAAQAAASAQVTAHYQAGKRVVLLHGVTGSGKTEVFLDQVRQALDAGGQVLYLLPEIALTTQMVARLKAIFGNSVGVYHSRFSDNERVEVWQGLLEQRFSFIVGVRSAVLLPFSNLTLIVVDEEHEATYKQSEPAPRYHGRDAAIMLAHQQGARVLLGSATPSIESYYAAQQGRYGLVELLQRYGQAQLPKLELVDLRDERKRKTLRGVFSQALLDRLQQTLGHKQQAILFQNRRGYAPFLSCKACAWIPKCENCDVSLTYHQAARQIRCHYCGHAEPLPARCPACSSPEVRPVGLGTERLEEDTALLLPEARVLRMDQDTTRRKNALADIITAFERGEADVLVGTQMVTKGLDFERVTLVGVFDVDRLMHFPDFRSFERTFQTLTQVAGRAGRHGQPGTVLIQTSNPGHPLMRQIVEQDYRAFYDAELVERQTYHYPPFMRLIKLTLRHAEREALEAPAQWLALRLRQSLSEKSVLGPQPPPVERIRSLYLTELHIKLPREGTDLPYAKRMLQEALLQMPKFKSAADLRITVDVDPM